MSTPNHPSRIRLVTGNIVKQPDCDAIVNSANRLLLMGSGTAGAIHIAAGPRLEACCIPFRPLEPGQAIITPGFNLHPQKIIHVLAPRYFLDDDAPAWLDIAIHAVLQIASDHGIRKLAMPALSTGAHNYPIEDAMPIYYAAAARFFAANTNTSLREVRLVLHPKSVEKLLMNTTAWNSDLCSGSRLQLLQSLYEQEVPPREKPV